MTASVVPFPICTGPFGSLQQPPATLPSTPANQATSSGRQPIVGGSYDPSTAIKLMNSWFFVSETAGEVGIYRIEDDETLTYMAMEDFKLRHANVFVDMSPPTGQAGSKSVHADRFWLQHPGRRECDRIVFVPAGQVGAKEYNLWRGFAVTPSAGWQKQRHLHHHIFRVI
jgi:hypothetical protein